jgi:hypothetical protein
MRQNIQNENKYIFIWLMETSLCSVTVKADVINLINITTRSAFSDFFL